LFRWCVEVFACGGGSDVVASLLIGMLPAGRRLANEVSSKDVDRSRCAAAAGGDAARAAACGWLRSLSRVALAEVEAKARATLRAAGAAVCSA
jgi:hypothetical protein